jgi:hypothetical protein
MADYGINTSTMAWGASSIVPKQTEDNGWDK